MNYMEKAMYYKNRLDELKDINENLYMDNKQLKEAMKTYNNFKIALTKQVAYATKLKEIIKAIFVYSDSDVWRNSNHIMYTDEQKQIIIDILENNK